jgi:hypothetical protein
MNLVNIEEIESKVEREFNERYEAKEELRGRAVVRAVVKAYGKPVDVAIDSENGTTIMRGIKYDGDLYSISGVILPHEYYEVKRRLGLIIASIFGVLSLVLIVKIASAM